jgi:hypothetical protein
MSPSAGLVGQMLVLGTAEPSPEQTKQAATKLIQEAAQPIATNPDLRNRLVEIRRIRGCVQSDSSVGLTFKIAGNRLLRPSQKFCSASFRSFG